LELLTVLMLSKAHNGCLTNEWWLWSENSWFLQVNFRYASDRENRNGYWALVAGFAFSTFALTSLAITTCYHQRRPLRGSAICSAATTTTTTPEAPRNERGSGRSNKAREKCSENEVKCSAKLCGCDRDA